MRYALVLVVGVALVMGVVRPIASEVGRQFTAVAAALDNAR